jgi:hypothetical protein
VGFLDLWYCSDVLRECGAIYLIEHYADYIQVLWILLGPARKSAKDLGGGFQRSLTISASILTVLWILYPIAWGLADGCEYKPSLYETRLIKQRLTSPPTLR